MKLKNYLSVVLIFLFTYTTHAQTYEWGGVIKGSGEESMLAMDVDAEGNTYFTGSFNESIDLGIDGIEQMFETNGTIDAFVGKVNTDGNLEWAFSLGSTEMDYGTAITVDSEGNVFVSGYFDGDIDMDPGEGEAMLSSQGGGDIFILKLTNNGEFVWAKSIGGSDYEEVTKLDTDEMGNLYILGYYSIALDVDPGEGEEILSQDGFISDFISVLNADGEFVKAFKIGGDGVTIPMDMEVVSSTQIAVTGYFTGTADLNPRPDEELPIITTGYNTGFVLQFDDTGMVTNLYVTDGGEIYMHGLTVDDDNNIYATGMFGGTVNFDPLAIESDYIFNTEMVYNAFIVKVLPNEVLGWAKHLESGDLSSSGYDIKTDSEGNLHTTGYFEGSVDFDLSNTGEFILTSESEGNWVDGFWQTMDADGEFLNAYQFGGANLLRYHHLYFDANDNAYLGAHFENTVDLNPFPDEEDEVTAMGNFADNYLVKINSQSLGMNDYQSALLGYYPNPATDKIHIESSENLVNTTYTIFDPSGKEVSKGKIGESNMLPVSNLQQGLYIVSLAHNVSFKLVKQ